MKLSLNHIRYYRDRYQWSDDPAPEGVDVLAQKIGAQLGAIEEIIDFGNKYKGVVIVRVVSCVDHPNADRLHLCKVDDGGKVEGVERDEQGHVQVVCGAPNVHEGMLAAWLPPGAVVPSTIDKDPFVMEAREIRGQKSNGMMASPKELGIGDGHEGILEVDEVVQPGVPFAEAYGLNDYVFDIENKMFTHRPDCFGMMGVAREIAGIQQQQFHSPDWYHHDIALPHGEQSTLPLELSNELPELVPRILLLPMSNVAVKPSPIWLQINLVRLGIRPINNIVDLTNYYMVLTGQPTHAYDYDKVKAQDEGADHATVVVRNPRDGEKISLLNGKEVQPRTEAIMIASRDKLIGIGGVMGGGDTEVDETTKNIIIEVATFDMYSIRRTSMAHGLFTDAVTRFNKGQSPLQNRAVLARLAFDMSQLAGAVPAGEAIDDNHLPSEVVDRGSVHAPVRVTADFINHRLGLKLSEDEIMQLLGNVEFEVHREGNELIVKAPFWRTDIEIPEDVVEEVGRLYGFDHLPLELPRRDLTPAPKDGLLEYKRKMRDVLHQSGANEVLTYSFVHGNLLDKVGQDKAQALQVANALSPDLQYYRLSLTPSLLEKVHPNIKAGNDTFALFELGKAHAKDLQDSAEPDIPGEANRLAFVYAANEKAARATSAGAAYYVAKKYLESLLHTLGIEGVTYIAGDQESNRAIENQAVKPFAQDRKSYVQVGDTVIAILGEYKGSVRKGLKLPDFIAGFEIDVDELRAATKSDTRSYVALPRFPKLEQDICLKVAASTTYGDLYQLVQDKVLELKPDHSLASVSPVDIYQREDDAAHKQITFRLSIASYERTLTDTEIVALLDQVTAAAQEKFSAERV